MNFLMFTKIVFFFKLWKKIQSVHWKTSTVFYKHEVLFYLWNFILENELFLELLPSKFKLQIYAIEKITVIRFLLNC
jgi:hypothetical protein